MIGFHGVWLIEDRMLGQRWIEGKSPEKPWEAVAPACPSCGVAGCPSRANCYPVRPNSVTHHHGLDRFNRSKRLSSGDAGALVLAPPGDSLDSGLSSDFARSSKLPNP